MLRKFKYLLIVLCAYQVGSAQEVLTLEQAVKSGLEKNYSVMIVKNQQAIAKAQNNLGAAGMSPTVALNGSLNTSNINSHQEYNNGTVQDRPGAKAVGTSGSINADWTIFDGLRMFAIKKRLDLNEELSAVQLRQQMESTIYDIIVAYYGIIRINELIKAGKQNLALYEERRKIAELRLQIGSDSRVELLLSKSDENKAKSALVQLELDLLNAKTRLNTIINQPANTEFKTVDTIAVNYNPTLEELKKSAPAANTSILISKQNELIFGQSVKEARSANLPFVTASGAFNFTSSQSQAGFILLNRQNGLNFGLTARWLIFNGNRNNKLVQERNLLALNQRYITEQTQLQVDALVYMNYQSYLLNKKISELEFQNLTDSKEVQTISLERYKIGKANVLETIETQKNLEDAQARYINSLYNMKIAETELLRTNGQLVK
jgi:outer membrane protein